MRIQFIARRTGEEHGAVAIIVSLLAIAFLILAAFAVDIGNAYANKRQLSVAADAAALAAAASVVQAMPVGVGCDTGLAAVPGGANSVATAVATDINTKNNRANSGSATEPVDSAVAACVDTNADGVTDAVEVQVRNSRVVPTSIAGVIGISQITPASQATARSVKIRSAGGLRPWAVCDVTVTEAQSEPNTTFWTGIDKISGPCDSTASGIWGSVDFDGGANSAGDLADWTRDGYPGPVTIPDPLLPADPGVSNKSDLRDAFEALVGRTVMFPSVTQFTGGNGNNAAFDAVGIATVKICGIKYANGVYKTDQQTGQVSDCWVEPTQSTSQPTTTTGVTSVNMAKNTNVLRLSTSQFPTPPVNPALISVSVTIPGGKKQGNNQIDLTTAVATFTSPTTVTLADSVDYDIPAGATVTIRTSTSTGSPKPAPGPFEGTTQLDHIQFRWVNYSPTSFPGGTASQSCAWDDRQCVPGTMLYR